MIAIGAAELVVLVLLAGLIVGGVVWAVTRTPRHV